MKFAKTKVNLKPVFKLLIFSFVLCLCFGALLLCGASLAFNSTSSPKVLADIEQAEQQVVKREIKSYTKNNTQLSAKASETTQENGKSTTEQSATTLEVKEILSESLATTPEVVQTATQEESQNPELSVHHQNQPHKPQMAIVIDDFGYDRKGVDLMLSLNCPLTIAVMPALEFSAQDAETAHAKGHEVILHMPMEAYGNAPLSWYGPLYIANSDTPEMAKNKLNQAINGIPYCNGVNIHMGTAISKNKELMRAILETTKERNLVFLDSRTIEDTVCKPIATELGAPFLERDVFLEVGGASYGTTAQKMQEAIEMCKTNGKCIVIGHIGAVGKDVTAKCLQDYLPTIEAEGIEIVPLSKMLTA